MRVHPDPGERPFRLVDAHDHTVLRLAGAQGDHRGVGIAREGGTILVDSLPVRVNRGPPHHLVARQPEDTFSAGIAGGDRSCRVLYDDPFRQQHDDRAEDLAVDSQVSERV